MGVTHCARFAYGGPPLGAASRTTTQAAFACWFLVLQWRWKNLILVPMSRDGLWHLLRYGFRVSGFCGTRSRHQGTRPYTNGGGSRRSYGGGRSSRSFRTRWFCTLCCCKYPISSNGCSTQSTLPPTCTITGPAFLLRMNLVHRFWRNQHLSLSLRYKGRFGVCCILWWAEFGKVCGSVAFWDDIRNCSLEKKKIWCVSLTFWEHFPFWYFVLLLLLLLLFLPGAETSPQKSLTWIASSLCLLMWLFEGIFSWFQQFSCHHQFSCGSHYGWWSYPSCQNCNGCVCACACYGRKPNNLHIFKHMQNQCFFCTRIHADFSLWYYVAHEWASYLNEKEQSSVSHLFNSI